MFFHFPITPVQIYVERFVNNKITEADKRDYFEFARANFILLLFLKPEFTSKDVKNGNRSEWLPAGDSEDNLEEVRKCSTRRWRVMFV